MDDGRDTRIKYWSETEEKAAGCAVQLQLMLTGTSARHQADRGRRLLPVAFRRASPSSPANARNSPLDPPT
jgi:hypothetical protein